MKRNNIRLIALILAALLLTGCGKLDFGGYFQGLQEVLLSPGEETADSDSYITYDEMQYSRPDLQELEQPMEAALEAAQQEDIRQVMNNVYRFYDAYDWFYTCYSLADICYSGDLTDSYWEEEYSFCIEQSGYVDAMLEELYYGLAQSPSLEKLEDPKFFGPGFFDGYQGENNWDEGFTQLLEREGELQSRYYALSETASRYEAGSLELYDACAGDMAQLLVELIGLRQEMAAYWGYEDYAQFAWDFYYSRDYSLEEVDGYLEDIREELVPLYRSAASSDAWEASYAYCSERETMRYLREASENMGGSVLEAFELMEAAGLYDIGYSENKYNSSFEVYLTSYQQPFVFMNPSLTRYDCLTLVHEFGHFCNDYVSFGSYADVDVSEIFSQGMEYLSLCYTEAGASLTRVKMADSLAVYVEQAAFAEFEHRMYALTGEALSPEGLYDLYESIALDYGFDAVGYDPREFVEINHYYTNPMYLISYVVSNDGAMQLYQLELDRAGQGLKLLEENLGTQELTLMAFLDSAGLESPFAPHRLREVAETIADILLGDQMRI